MVVASSRNPEYQPDAQASDSSAQRRNLLLTKAKTSPNAQTIHSLARWACIATKLLQL